MTKTEVNIKIAEVRAQGEALQQENQQLIQRLGIVRAELSKICGKIELLNELLESAENPPTGGEKKEVKKVATKNDNG
nr:MAG TPA: DivIVA protein [Caudoviricetes sp.]